MKPSAYSKIHFSNTTIGDIPILTCSNAIDVQKPLVILSHGFTQKKEVWKEYMEELAQIGYYTVALDNRLHGERKDAGLDSVISSEGKINFYGLYDAIKANAEDITKVIGFFITKPEIDSSRIGMVGVSMGGFTTFRTIVIDKRIKVAVPIIASPVWGDLPEGMPAEDTPEIIRDLKNLSQQFSPSNFMGKFYPTALLMQAGMNDKHFDIQKLKQFFGDIKPLYKSDLSKIELITFEGVAHEFTEPMWENAKSWLNRYL